MERWEYTVVIMEYAAKQQPGSDPIRWKTTTTWTIFSPEGEDDVRDGWGTDNPDSNLRARRLLNELGEDGWELVADVITRNGVSSVEGYPTVGIPLVREWTLKRKRTN